jgi:hypothetical protein
MLDKLGSHSLEGQIEGLERSRFRKMCYGFSMLHLLPFLERWVWS